MVEQLDRKGLGAAAAIFDDRSRILLVRHSYGRFNWELPGGFANRGEGPAGTVVREVLEETGLEVHVVNMTGYYYEPAEDLLHFVFRCEAQGKGGPKSLQTDEVADCCYWPVDTLPGPISDFTVQRIRDAAAGVTLPVPALVGPRTWLAAGANGTSRVGKSVSIG